MAMNSIQSPTLKAINGLDLASEAYYLSERVQKYPEESIVRVTKDVESSLTLKKNLEFGKNVRNHLCNHSMTKDSC